MQIFLDGVNSGDAWCMAAVVVSFWHEDGWGIDVSGAVSTDTDVPSWIWPWLQVWFVVVVQVVGERPPRYAAAQACRWWHNIRHVRIDRSSLLYVHVGLPDCQYNHPKWPGDLDLLTLKVVPESRVTWATFVPILVFLGISVLELCPMYTTDSRQTKASLNAPAN